MFYRYLLSANLISIQLFTYNTDLVIQAFKGAIYAGPVLGR